MKLNSATCLGVVSAVLFAQAASGAIIFDDFNVNEGHFTSSVTLSPATVGEDPASTIEQVTTESFEGGGSQQLHLIHDATATPFRLRHLSGGGTTANNISFNITEGEDGYIGFYLKTTVEGWWTSINLDGAGGTVSEMDGAIRLPIIADGEWHLYEWDLDSFSDWGVVSGIGGGHGGALELGVHTIDSIYFFDLDGEPGPTADIYIDFVAKSDSGSIAGLIPEPSSSLFALVGGVSLLSRTRRRR